MPHPLVTADILTLSEPIDDTVINQYRNATRHDDNVFIYVYDRDLKHRFVADDKQQPMPFEFHQARTITHAWKDKYNMIATYAFDPNHTTTETIEKILGN